MGSCSNWIISFHIIYLFCLFHTQQQKKMSFIMMYQKYFRFLFCFALFLLFLKKSFESSRINFKNSSVLKLLKFSQDDII